MLSETSLCFNVNVILSAYTFNSSFKTFVNSLPKVDSRVIPLLLPTLISSFYVMTQGFLTSIPCMYVLSYHTITQSVRITYVYICSC